MTNPPQDMGSQAARFFLQNPVCTAKFRNFPKITLEIRPEIFRNFSVILVTEHGIL
jgi:hypothetical protein